MEVTKARASKPFRCEYCDNLRTFSSKQGLNQHLDAVHPWMCEFCDATFSSSRASEQHTKAVHKPKATSPSKPKPKPKPQTFACDQCDRVFSSHRGLYDHTEVVHQPRLLKRKDLKDPVSENGFWVKRKHFTGRKSFAAFDCPCGKYWISAHGFPCYKQGCKSCDEKSLPKFLWVNENGTDRSGEAHGPDPTRPHDMSRCQACQAGACLKSW